MAKGGDEEWPLMAILKNTEEGPCLFGPHGSQPTVEA